MHTRDAYIDISVSGLPEGFEVLNGNGQERLTFDLLIIPPSPLTKPI